MIRFDRGEESFSKVGLVLHVGKIVNHKGECVDSMVLEPQGIAHLVSVEKLKLPDNMCGTAHVLTRLCNRGLLTLNIGMVEPGWDNRLSTPVLNFSSEKRLIQVGRPFLRVSIHQLEIKGHVDGFECVKAPLGGGDSSGYITEIRARAVDEFGKSFLNIRQLVGKASKKENSRIKDAMLKFIPIGAFSLAFFALMVTVGLAALTKLIGNPVSHNDLSSLLDAQKNIAERLLEVESRLPVSAVDTNMGNDEVEIQVDRFSVQE